MRSKSGSVLHHACQDSINAIVDNKKIYEHTVYNLWSEIQYLSSYVLLGIGSLCNCVDQVKIQDK